MTASRDDISGWFDEAKKRGSAFLIVACDRFDYENFPVFVEKPEDFWVQFKLHSGPNTMQSVDEVYDISLPKDEQMNEFRAWHTPPKDATP
jgi:hypothetical protein